MTNKQIIDGVDVSGCEFCDWKGSDMPQCRIRQASFEPTCKGYNCYYKQLARKENELEELRQYHNKCCEEFKKEKQDLIDKYNQLSKDLHNGEFCNTEKCELLNDKQKEKNQIKFEIYQELLTILNSTSEIYKDDSLDIKLQAGLQEAIFRLVKEPIIGDEDYE